MPNELKAHFLKKLTVETKSWKLEIKQFIMQPNTYSYKTLNKWLIYDIILLFGVYLSLFYLHLDIITLYIPFNWSIYPASNILNINHQITNTIIILNLEIIELSFSKATSGKVLHSKIISFGQITDKKFCRCLEPYKKYGTSRNAKQIELIELMLYLL